MFEFELQGQDGWARAWKFTTGHGSFETPIFMPVWTKATVKWISKEDLDTMGAQIILNNTYHLYLRPGDEIVRDFWWVHTFQSYDKPILTDSWGFQVFSLWDGKRSVWLSQNTPLVKIEEDGVHFRSVIDGSRHYFSPEKVMDIESNLGADIIMAFDECASWESSHEYAKKAMQRTHRWLERCKNQWQLNELKREDEWKYRQALFGIIQGVTYDDLRQESADYVREMDTPWIAVGGLSVWESKEDMYRTLDVLEPHLPKNKPHYLMGVWTPEDLVEWIARGIDMFDCVLPTRIGRHWMAFSWNGNVRIKNEKYKLSDKSLDPHCSCKVCKNYSLGYLRHLFQEDEMLWMQLLSYHNLYLLIDLSKQARWAILERKYQDFRKKFWQNYSNT